MGGGAGVYADRYFEQLAPVAGQISPIVVNTTAASLDLSTCGGGTVSMNNSNQIPPDVAQAGIAGLIGHRVTFTASNCNVGLNFGSAIGGVTNANAPNFSNNGVNCNGGCIAIGAGQSVTYNITVSTRWMGYIAQANSGVLTITMASRTLT